MRRGVAELPLHGGHVPYWLASRMRKLARIVVRLIVDEYGTLGLLERLADPVWFQALNNLIGMDWDSSGSTTVTSGILKEVLQREQVGVWAAGGKGAKSRATPTELREICGRLGLDSENYVKASLLVAKVDTAALQAGYQLYHHMFFVDSEGRWTVVQQGMNPAVKMARRYHWFSEKINNFTVEPHAGISGVRESFALNTIARKVDEYRSALVDLAKDNPASVERDLMTALAVSRGFRTLVSYRPYARRDAAQIVRRYRSLGKLELNRRALELARELSASSYDELLLVRGLGPSTLRALSLVLELVYNVHPSWRDPVTHPPDPFKFAYAVGGKDGVPFPVDKKTYDELISLLEKLVEKSRGDKDVAKRVTILTKKWSPPPEDKVPT